MRVVTNPVKTNILCPIEGKIAMFITVFLPCRGKNADILKSF